MFEQTLKLPMLIRRVSEEAVLGEVLFFPELSRLGPTVDAVERMLTQDIRRWLDDLPSTQRLQLQQRWIEGDVKQIACRLAIEPPQRSEIWRSTSLAVFHGAAWQQRDGSMAAYFPALKIEVLAESESELESRCQAEVHGALLRERKTRSLALLAETQETKSLTISNSQLMTKWHSLKKSVTLDERDEPQKKSVLEEVADPLPQTGRGNAYRYESWVHRLRQSLNASRPVSVLLVGPSGVGKTAIVNELAKEAQRAKQANGAGAPGTVRSIWSTDGAKLISGMMGFGMWQQRCQDLWRECAKQNAILHVGSLVELMEVGKSEGQSQGIASFLRPYIARGELVTIAECTEQQLAFIERMSPQLLAAFEQLRITEPDPSEELEILREALIDRYAGESMTEDGLQQISSLHRRFATYSSSPGRPLLFMQNLLADVETKSEEQTLGASEVTAAFSKETGMPLSMLEPTMKLDYAETLQWFTKRVIGQDAAVASVVDILVRMKATLARENRPLSSLLFVGPTGVGKTELAKTLARFLFGSAERLIRIDMSEYSDGLGVQRLIGGLYEAEGVLTSKVREQPFSVVLLDEFEKAHPLFFDLLLQVLGDGRLTDGRGQLADFRNCVVIMTSNLGTKDFAVQQAGFEGQAGKNDVESHFQKAVEKFLRPELYNRMDRVVPFHPLGDETATRIIEREFDLLRQRDGLRLRPVTLDVAPEVISWLQSRGFEPQYGARSLKRVMDREVLIPLAATLNRFNVNRSLLIEATIEDNRVALKVDSRDHLAEQIELRSEYSLLIEARLARRFWQALMMSSAVQQMRDRLFRLERRNRKLLRKRKMSEGDVASLDQQRGLDAEIKQIEASGNQLVAFEDQQLLKICMKSDDHAGKMDGDAAEKIRTWRDQVFEAAMLAHAATIVDSDRIAIFLHGGSQSALTRLARLYLRIVEAAGGNFAVWQFLQNPTATEPAEESWNLNELEWTSCLPPVRDRFDAAECLTQVAAPDNRPLLRCRARDPLKYLAESPPKGAAGLYLDFRATMIRPRLANEFGIHEFSAGESKTRVRVLTEAAAPAKFLPPWRYQRSQFNTVRGVRRRYTEKAVADEMLRKSFSVGRVDWEAVVQDVIFACHQLAARRVIEQ